MSQWSREYWNEAARLDPFNRVRTGWDERDFDTRTDQSICQKLEFNADDVVLDYGCGPGYACKLVAPKVLKYIGLDYSEEMLAIARQRNAAYRNAEFVRGDGVSIPAADSSIDCVFCELVFQHVERRTTLTIAAEMQRVLKPNGRAAIQFPTKFYGEGVGFTVEELVSRFPGWWVSPDPGFPEHYIECKVRCRIPH